jgi:hypothetical protein
VSDAADRRALRLQQRDGMGDAQTSEVEITAREAKAAISSALVDLYRSTDRPAKGWIEGHDAVLEAVSRALGSEGLPPPFGDPGPPEEG